MFLPCLQGRRRCAAGCVLLLVLKCYADSGIQLDTSNRLGVTCHFDSQTLGCKPHLVFACLMQTPVFWLGASLSGLILYALVSD